MKTTKSLGLHLFEGKDKLSFNRINENTEKLDALAAGEVGTVKLTVRSNLGAKWLPCDGSFVSSEEYPDLAKAIPETSDIQTVEDCLTAVTGGWAAAYTGKNIVMFTRSATGSSDLAAGTPMVEGGIVSKTTLTGYYCDKRSTIATDGNGVCVAACYYDSSTDAEVLYVTTDHGETWTHVNLDGGIGADGIVVLGVAYHEGTWAAVFQSGASLSVFKSTAAAPVNASDWTMELVTVSDAASHEFGSLHYFNGYWCSTASGAVLKSADLSVWTVATDDNISVSGNCAASVAGDAYFTGRNSYSTDLTNWYKIETEDEKLYSVAFVNGWYVAYDANGPLYRAQSPEGTWEQFAEMSYDENVSLGYYRLLAVDGYLVMVNQWAKQYYGKCFELALPEVAVSNVNAFIKAVE